MVDMGDLSMSEPEHNLPHQSRDVQRGGKIRLLHRGTPVAASAPLGARGGGGLAGLIAAGLVTAGQGDAARILDEPPLVLPTSISEALFDERRGR